MKAPKRNIPDVSASSGPRTVTVQEVMTRLVETTTADKTVEQVHAAFVKRNFHCMPVVDPEGEPIGVVTSTDLLAASKKDAVISDIMSERVFTIPLYSGIHIAARVMRNHHIHHLIVAHERKVVGILSSFDLLRLMEDKRFVAKNSGSNKSGGRS